MLPLAATSARTSSPARPWTRWFTDDVTPPRQDSVPSRSDDSGTAHAGVRLAVGFAFGVLAAVATAAAGYVRFAGLIGWDVVALVFVSWTWLSVARMDASETASHATREEPTRTASHLIVLAAAIVSLLGVIFLLLASGGKIGRASCRERVF